MSEIIAGAISGAVLLALGVLAWRGIKPSEMGSSAEASVQAADVARDMMKQALDEYRTTQDAKLAKLVARVVDLETALADERQARDDERRRFQEQLLMHQRWIDALVEQVVKAGQVPIMLEELEHLDNLGGRDGTP